MRNGIIQFLLIFCAVSLLFFPQTSIDGAKNGLLLWSATITPTLLPFLLLSGFMQYYQTFHLISRLFYQTGRSGTSLCLQSDQPNVYYWIYINFDSPRKHKYSLFLFLSLFPCTLLSFLFILSIFHKRFSSCTSNFTSCFYKKIG